MTGDVPRVSIVVINHNKRHVLRECLESALRLDWPNLEILVVDNVSTDGAPDMVEEEFGDRVRLIRRTVNSPVAARNEGFAAANGQYYLSIDNDIVFPDRGVVRRAVEVLGRHPEVGVVAFLIGTLDDPREPLPEHWWYPIPIAEGKRLSFYSSFFSEGAAVFRADAIEATGGYDEDLFQYGENIDLALKMFREGYEILFCSDLTCAELEVRGFLPPRRTRRNYLLLRNKLWIAWKHYPLARGAVYGLTRMVAAGVRSLRYGWPDHFIAASWQGVFAPKEIRAKRRCLGRDVWDKVASNARGRTLST